MLRFFKFFSVTLLLAVVGLGWWPSSGDAQQPGSTGTVPPGIIAKPPGESDIRVEINVKHLTYAAQETVTEGQFISFTLNKQAFVYLVLVKGDGESLLLFPNKFTQANSLPNFLLAGRYTFPSPELGPGPKLEQSEFVIPGPEDKKSYVQLIATPVPINLAPATFMEDFPLLARAPGQVISLIVRLIDEKRLRLADWTAVWIEYKVFRIPPTALAPPESTGTLLVEVKEFSSGKPLRDAQVFVDDQLYRFTDEQGAAAFSVVADSHTVQVKRNGYLDSDTISTTVPSGGDRKVPFSLQSKPKKAAVTTNPNPANVGQSIVFDAHESMGDPILYEWDFDDDGIIDKRTPKQQPKVEHKFDEAGAYNVRVYAIYEDSEVQAASDKITITGPSNSEKTKQIGEPGTTRITGQGFVNPVTLQINQSTGRIIFYAINDVYPSRRQYGQVSLTRDAQGSWLPATLSFNYTFKTLPANRQGISSFVRVIPLQLKPTGQWVCLKFDGTEDDLCIGSNDQYAAPLPANTGTLITKSYPGVRLPVKANHVAVTAELSVEAPSAGPVTIEYDHISLR